jgi:hypothetical protein
LPEAFRSALGLVIKNPEVRAVIWVVSSADKFPSLAERIRSEVGGSIDVIHVTYEHIGHNIHFLSRAKGVIVDDEYLQSLRDEARQYLIRTISTCLKRSSDNSSVERMGDTQLKFFWKNSNLGPPLNTTT